MVQNLEGMGFTVVPFGQGFKDMSPPTKELMKLVLEGCVAHGGHPVLRWMMDNIFIRTDPAGNIKPDKEKSTEKIDGAVATIMALDRAIRCGNDTSESVYDTRGLLFIYLKPIGLNQRLDHELLIVSCLDVGVEYFKRR